MKKTTDATFEALKIAIDLLHKRAYKDGISQSEHLVKLLDEIELEALQRDLYAENYRIDKAKRRKEKRAFNIKHGHDSEFFLPH